MSPRAASRLEALGFRPVYDYTTGKADWIAAGLPTTGRLVSKERVLHQLDRGVPTCTMTETIAAVVGRLGPDDTVCVVVNDAGVVQGRLRPAQLDGSDSRPVEAIMEPGPTTVRADADAAQSAERMQRRGVASLIVTDPDGVLLGLFTPTLPPERTAGPTDAA